MTKLGLTIKAAAVAVALFSGTGLTAAQNVTISVWAGGTGPNDNYRVDAIDIAADILEREYAIRGKELSIAVEKKTYPTWDDFKQALTLAAEAGNAPDIVVTGHEDIAPWSQSGLIVPVENYLNLDAWPINDMYENLIKISSYGGVLYGLPQDAESRPLFFWKPHMKAIGYSDADLDALPSKVQSGEYTLANVIEDAKKMQDKGVVKPGYGFYPRPNNGPDYWQFYTSFGGVMEEGGKLVLDKAAMQRFYQFFVDAVAAGVTRKNHIGTPNDQWFAEVASGKAGIWHGGTWHYARYVNQEGLTDFFGNVAFSLIPAGEEGKANTLTHPLVYLLTKNKSEENAGIAAELIKIASEPRINALHAIKSAHLGITKQEANVDLYSSDRWAREATERLLPYANAMPNNSDFGTYWNAMWKGLESAWTGQKAPGQAVQDLETELKSSLGEAIVVR
ncbi:ABC transporter substrate-binding protein [Phyllobacterium brassicacearum]|uniref:ABC transporter substrate-binding protein n=1 Tax=Phyllobacterium brassicacearum TaxID=314235 RepID=A0A2P7B914_9HYPH|nr:extracellular solute-binding protein [Phyllobacterium brassicacearum]PSH62953.1 ABC transporter substrate-binding protein [Phyllobacterium brassicacearum]TDQ13635.1 carbohydrate ABC transporter substrate-binding protein (CUT1 family) [Phyllobacterium brassicacearum]